MNRRGVARRGAWRLLAIDRFPEDAVEGRVVNPVGRAKVESLRLLRARPLRGVQLVERLGGTDRVVRLQVGRGREHVRERSAEVVELREAAHAEYVFDGGDHVGRVGEAADGAG